MADDLKRFLYKKLPSVEGLHAIVVSDRDGVPVIKVANDNAPEHALRPGFLSTFALATDQGSKLGLSKNKSIICYYNTYQPVRVRKGRRLLGLRFKLHFQAVFTKQWCCWRISSLSSPYAASI
ncbi:ragulator complex protein LAMTOR3 isoform 2-T2 [Morus bassanus]